MELGEVETNVKGSNGIKGNWQQHFVSGGQGSDISGSAQQEGANTEDFHISNGQNSYCLGQRSIMKHWKPDR